MKPLPCILFLVIFASPLLGQYTLAPNYACPDHAPYCRMTVGPVVDNLDHVFGVGVIGAHNNVLYGSVYVRSGQVCPNSQVLATAAARFCMYSTSTFTHEKWTYLGEFPQAPNQKDEYPLEIVFGTGTCSSYVYVYTDWQNIWRASKDWHFTSIGGASNLPSL